jgi:hypothetical protein
MQPNKSIEGIQNMSTRNTARRSALLASAALLGQDVATDAATVTKVAEGTHGNVQPISKATKRAIAAKAKADKAKRAPRKRAEKVSSVVLDEHKASVNRILDAGDKLDADADKNCQAIVGEVAQSYEGMRKGASNRSDVAALSEMFDKKTHALTKAGTAFIRELCDAWLGKKVQKPSGSKNNKSTAAQYNYYNNRAAKVRKAAMIFIAARGTPLTAGVEAMPIWDEKAKVCRVPTGIFIPPTRPKDEVFTFTDPQLANATHVLLDGAAYDLQRYTMIEGTRTLVRDGGAFTMNHLLKRFWTKPSYLVTKQQPEGNTATQGKDENPEGLLTKKQKAAALKSFTFWELFAAAVKEMGTEAMPDLAEVEKHGDTFNGAGRISRWYGELSKQAQQRIADSEAKRAAIAAQKGKPFKLADTGLPISEATKAEPIVDLPDVPTPVADAVTASLMVA